MQVLPNLTSLRFFLALFVVVYHVPQFCINQGIPHFDGLPLFHKGNEAVYMFFSLSGFLIIRQLYLEKEKSGSVSLTDFYVRRMLRIFPLYYLVLGFGFLYYRLVLPSFGYDFESNYDLTKGILLTVFFLPNVFKECHPGGIIEVLWSIGIEEQFYLFIAPLMLLLRRKYILPALLLFTVGYFFLVFSEDFEKLQRFGMYYFYFSSAGLFSILMLQQGNRLLYKREIAIVLAVILSVYFFSSVFTQLPEKTYHFFSMLLFGLFLSFFSSIPFAVTENKSLRYLGSISYGIYMFHCIVIQVAGLLYFKIFKPMLLPSVAVIVLFYMVVIGLTIVTAGLSYAYYESYFLKLKQRFRQKNH